MTLPQEFPRHLALLSLYDVLPLLPDNATRDAYQRAFEARKADPLAPGGVLLIQPTAGADGDGDPAALRLLMALMRLMVLRLRDLNLERFETEGGEGRLLSAYVKGENLALPLPDRAQALFIERADRATPVAAAGLGPWERPLFATWQGPRKGPVWAVLAQKLTVIDLETP